MIYAEDAAHTSGNPGGFVLAVRNDANASLTSTDLDYSPFAVDISGSIITVPRAFPTYSVATQFTAAASATDIFTITGSASKTIKITKIKFFGVQTTSGVIGVRLMKRSTPNTGGTSTIETIVPRDSNDAAATAVVRRYSSNPINGTLVGILDFIFCEVPSNGNIVDSNVNEFNYESFSLNKQPTLRGTSEVISVNLNSTTLTGNTVVCTIEWIEV